MQRVHTFIRTWEPPGPTAFTLWTLGFDVFFVLLLAWLTLFPLSLPLPQISQVPATVMILLNENSAEKQGVPYHKPEVIASRKNSVSSQSRNVLLLPK
jgi:hypothetical protein